MQLMTVRQVAARLAVSRPSVYRLLRDETNFPAPLKMRGRTLWVEAEIDAWVRMRAEARGS